MAPESTRSDVRKNIEEEIMSPDEGGPAFPRPYASLKFSTTRAIGEAQEGMSYRAWAAGKAMEGIIISDALLNKQIIDKLTVEQRERRPKELANCAVQCADALIAELKK